VDIVDQGVEITHNAPASYDIAARNYVTFTATDEFGNQSSKTASISVVYDFGSFLAPLNLDKPIKLNRTVPVKFYLADFNGMLIPDTYATIMLQHFSDEAPIGDPIEPEVIGNDDFGSSFRYSVEEEQYIYNLSTKGLSIGTWQIIVNLDDGTVKTSLMELK